MGTHTHIALRVACTLLGLALCGFLPLSVDAGDVVIDNTVHVEAESGGNSAEKGGVQEGKSSSKASVQTVINGEVVEDRVVVATSSVIRVESSYKDGAHTATVTTDRVLVPLPVATVPVVPDVHTPVLGAKDAAEDPIEVVAESSGEDVVVEGSASEVNEGGSLLASVVESITYSVASAFTYVLSLFVFI